MYLALLMTLLSVVNYGYYANSDEFGELLAKQLVGRVKEPFAYGSRSRIVTEVIGWTQTVAESTNRLSYDVTMRVCEKNDIQPSLPGEEVENHCQTCESTVTVQKAPFKILEEMDNGCDDGGSSDNSEGEFRSSFEKFIKKYDKMYENEDVKEKKFRIFQENVATMERLQKTETGTAKYGITKFSDLTDEEFRRFYTGYRADFDYHHQPTDYTFHNETLPNGVDWREKDVVTPVKDQGKCGSCWAFTTVGVVESQYAIKYEKQILLSEQELIDCDKRDKGCNGGTMPNAYRAIKFDLGGLEQESDYPYNATKQNCNLQKGKFVVTVTGFKNIAPVESRIAKQLELFGPIAAAVNSKLLKQYEGGIISNKCEGNVDHAILIVGFGEEQNPQNGQVLPYWIIKNSWGTKWGEGGYFRLRRGVNLCGIASHPSIVSVQKY